MERPGVESGWFHGKHQAGFNRDMPRHIPRVVRVLGVRWWQRSGKLGSDAIGTNHPTPRIRAASPATPCGVPCRLETGIPVALLKGSAAVRTGSAPDHHPHHLSRQGLPVSGADTVKPLSVYNVGVQHEGVPYITTTSYALSLNGVLSHNLESWRARDHRCV